MASHEQGLLPRSVGVAGIEIVVDSHERYAWRFSQQQAITVRRALVAGDYGVEHEGRLVAVVERKSLQDLISTLTSGKMRYLLGDLAAVGRAAVVVEARYSEIFKLEFVRPSVVADAIAECQVRFPAVPIQFCETRALAQEWAYRFLGAALAEAMQEEPAGRAVGELPPGRPISRPQPATAQVREGGGTTCRTAVGCVRDLGGVRAALSRSPAVVSRRFQRSLGVDRCAEAGLNPPNP